MSQRQICHFHNKPGGCRRGSDCRFMHVTGPGPSAASPLPSRGNLPPGVCSFFWSMGSCRRDTCRYKHERNSKATGNQASAAGIPNNANSVAGFLTDAGLAKVMESGTDIFFTPGSSQTSTPSHVHGAIRRFLADDYRFGSVQQIYAFLTLLTSANAAINPAWVSHMSSPSLNLLTPQ
jgi:hypothetical protein